MEKREREEGEERNAENTLTHKTKKREEEVECDFNKCMTCELPSASAKDLSSPVVFL